MPAVQTTYTDTIKPAVAGLVANQESQNRITRLNGDAGVIPYGRPVFRDVAANEATATPSADGFLGFSILDITQENGDAGTPPRRTLAILDKGVIWAVNGAAAVEHGDKVYVTNAGAITNVDTGNTLLPRAEFDSDALATALVKVRLR